VIATGVLTVGAEFTRAMGGVTNHRLTFVVTVFTTGGIISKYTLYNHISLSVMFFYVTGTLVKA